MLTPVPEHLPLFVAVTAVAATVTGSRRVHLTGAIANGHLHVHAQLTLLVGRLLTGLVAVACRRSSSRGGGFGIIAARVASGDHHGHGSIGFLAGRASHLTELSQSFFGGHVAEIAQNALVMVLLAVGAGGYRRCLVAVGSGSRFCPIDRTRVGSGGSA